MEPQIDQNKEKIWLNKIRIGKRMVNSKKKLNNSYIIR